MNRTQLFAYTILSILITHQFAAADSPKVNTPLPSNSVAISDDATRHFF